MRVTQLFRDVKATHRASDYKFLTGILGSKSTWFKPTDPNSEWAMIQDSLKPSTFINFIKLFSEDLLSVIVLPIGIFLTLRLIKDGKVTIVGEQFRHNSEANNEEWWFINGIGVNKELQYTNAFQLSSVFKQAIHAFYNPTIGLLFDSLRVINGLSGHKSLATRRFIRDLCYALHANPSRVIGLIVHSQGAIVASLAIRRIIKKELIPLSDLTRLEIYTFGSPISRYDSAIDPVSMLRVPYYEHYANEGDFAAQLGTLTLRRSSNENWWAVGKVYTAPVEGHFLGDHYLANFIKGQYQWHGSNDSRLYRKYLRATNKNAQPQ